MQLELAQAAQQTGDAATAIAAYQQFLKLAPDDPNANIVREQLKQLPGSGAAGVWLDSPTVVIAARSPHGGAHRRRPRRA